MAYITKPCWAFLHHSVAATWNACSQTHLIAGSPTRSQILGQLCDTIPGSAEAWRPYPAVSCIIHLANGLQYVAILPVMSHDVLDLFHCSSPISELLAWTHLILNKASMMHWKRGVTYHNLLASLQQQHLLQGKRFLAGLNKGAKPTCNHRFPLDAYYISLLASFKGHWNPKRMVYTHRLSSARQGWGPGSYAKSHSSSGTGTFRVNHQAWKKTKGMYQSSCRLLPVHWTNTRKAAVYNQQKQASKRIHILKINVGVTVTQLI